VSKHRAIPLSELARIYRMSKQGISHLIEVHGYSAVISPRWLLVQLMEGRACPLRTRLSDPTFLSAAEHSMNTAPFRCAIKPRAIRKTTTPKPKS
jgi:hypothetical protein